MKTKKEKLFDTYFDKWAKKTWLSIWRINIYYLSQKEYQKQTGNDEHHSLATCSSHWEYLEASIFVNRKIINNQPKKRIEYLVLHELMHIFLAETRLSHKDVRHEERIATLLARSFLLAEKP